jgi:hypothetical protein
MVKSDLAGHRHSPFAVTPSSMKQPKFSPTSQLKVPDWGLELSIALFNRVVRSLAPTTEPATIPYWGIFAERGCTVKVPEPDKKGRKWQIVHMAWIMQWFSDATIEKFERDGLEGILPMADMWCSQDLRTVRYIDPQLIPNGPDNKDAALSDWD